MSRERQFWIWLAALAVTVLLLFLLGSVLLPFVVGMAVAYFLDPVADKLEEWGCSRLIATILITVAFFAIVIAVIIVVAPLLQGQIIGLVQKLPELVDSVIGWLTPVQSALESSLSEEKIQQLRDASAGFAATALKWVLGLLQGLWQGGLAFFNVLSLLFITPLVSFYLLRDWDRIVAKCDSWLPRQHASVIRRVIADIDRMIAGFVRGQGTVCLILAVFYGIGLTAVGLDFGLLVGFGTGLISFIPYFGMLIGMTAGVAIAVAQFGEILPVVLVLAVFIAGQVVESMFITPKLVGDKVGLHAVWVIFALMAGGAAFGFTGVLLAVPVAASIGVLVRFFLGEYMTSSLYGEEQPPPEAGD